MDFLLIVTLFFAFLCEGSTNKTNSKNLGFHDSRHNLMSKLTENYDPRILPVINRSHAVDVQYEMRLNNIIQLDEVDQILRLSVWSTIFWKDEFLVWDPADFDGIDNVYLSADSTWKPDIVLYTSVMTERTAFELFQTGLVGVTHNGVVSWSTPVIIESLCKLRIEAYPFDKQTCPLKFASWSYNGLKLNFTSKADSILLTDYAPNIEWKVVDNPCQSVITYSDCCQELYTEVHCELVMQRQPAFYLFNLVMPIALLIVIGLLVFALPPESGEKVSLAITILLALSIYMLIVMERVPPNGEVIPLLELFIGGTIGLLTLSTAVNVFIVNFYFRGSYSRPPYWIRCCCMGSLLSTILCLRKEIKDIEEEDEIQAPPNKINCSTVQNDGHGMPMMSMSISNRAGGQNRLSPTSVYQIKIHSGDTGKRDARKSILQQILAELQQQNQHMRKRYLDLKTQRVGEAEWRVVAMTLDRLFFVILLIATLVMSFAIFKDVL